MDADKLTSAGGWVAPLGKEDLPDELPDFAIPFFRARRGGIQRPMNIVDTIGFMYRRPAWYRRWAVEMHHTRSWTLYGEPDRRTNVDVVTRRWSKREARRITLMLTPLAGRL